MVIILATQKPSAFGLWLYKVPQSFFQAEKTGDLTKTNMKVIVDSSDSWQLVVGKKSAVDEDLWSYSHFFKPWHLLHGSPRGIGITDSHHDPIVFPWWDTNVHVEPSLMFFFHWFSHHFPSCSDSFPLYIYINIYQTVYTYIWIYIYVYT